MITLKKKKTFNDPNDAIAYLSKSLELKFYDIKIGYSNEFKVRKLSSLKRLKTFVEKNIRSKYEVGITIHRLEDHSWIDFWVGNKMFTARCYN